MSATHRIEVEGLPLAYALAEPRASEAGLPVVALHGWGASRALMTPMTERLATLGHTVYAFDLPGFGETPPPPAAWGVEDYAAWVSSALGALGLPQVHLIGHSFGGRISLVLGADYAEFIGKIVLADSAGVPPKRSPLRQARLQVYKCLRRGLEAVGARGLADRLRGWYNARYGSADFQQTSGVMRETFVRVVNQDLRPFAARLRGPTLLFWGDRDEDTPLWQGRALEQLIPDAGLIVLEGAGHYSYLDKLEDFVRITDFFLRQEKAPRMNFLALLVLAIWIVGALARTYRQARFFQIEEYMNRRYLRWVLAARARWLPPRPLVAWLLGSVAAVVFSEGGIALPFLACAAAALAAALPPDEGEVKKRFRATGRAQRLLAAALTLPMIAALILAAAVSAILPAGGRAEAFALVAASAIGLVLLLAAPLWLVAGNLLMLPVEAALRRRYLRRAARVLAEVRPTVIGITGSYGKTTTKTILAHLLNGRFKAYPTPKSYNTLMGISLAINNDLAEDRSVDYFICEMGAYIPGEIQRIAELVRPTIGIEIEVGPQHLERFGTLENVAIAKYELVRALPPDGLAVFNMDNPHVQAMAERGYPAQRLGVSKTADPAAPPPGVDLVASNVRETLDGLRFALTQVRTGEQVAIEMPLLGQHNVTNLLLAVAVALHEGMTLTEIARRARTLQPAESRLVRQTTAAGITIINDAYSANPVGIVGALDVLALHQTGRRLLITPGMVELADRHEIENRRLGELAAARATDVILVGSARTAPIREGLLAAGFPTDRLLSVETLGEAVQWYEGHLVAGDTVLFLNDLPDTYNR